MRSIGFLNPPVNLIGVSIHEDEGKKPLCNASHTMQISSAAVFCSGLILPALNNLSMTSMRSLDTVSCVPPTPLACRSWGLRFMRLPVDR